MPEPSIVERVRKLLALSTSPNVHEAAAAAAKAQELIERHRIDLALLELEAAGETTPVGVRQDVVYTFSGMRAFGWVLKLAQGIARANACRLWYTSGYRLSEVAVDARGKPLRGPDGTLRRGREVPAKIAGAGAPDDLKACAFLITYLVGEVDRLAAEALGTRERTEKCDACEGSGWDRGWIKFPGRTPLESEWCLRCRGRGLSRVSGNTWGASFRAGAATEVANRLTDARREARAKLLADAKKTPEERYLEARSEAERTGDPSALLALDGRCGAPGYPLACVESALARLESQEQAVATWVEENVQLRRVFRAAGLSHDGAFERGREAGRSVDLAPGRGRLGGSP